MRQLDANAQALRVAEANAYLARAQKRCDDLDAEIVSSLSDAFRTSIYFHRKVHDALREVAFRERKTISKLIHEGPNHVLTKRGYPSIEQLRRASGGTRT
jgi:hypothetical protein